MRDSFTINVPAINASVPTTVGLLQAYSSSSNSSIPADENTAINMDTTNSSWSVHDCGKTVQ